MMIASIARIPISLGCRRTEMCSVSMIIITLLSIQSPPTPSKMKPLNANQELTVLLLEAPGPRRNLNWNLLEINTPSARRSLLQALTPFAVLHRSPNLLDVAGAIQASRDFSRPYSLVFLYVVTKRGRCSGIEEFSLPTGLRALLLFR